MARLDRAREHKLVASAPVSGRRCTGGGARRIGAPTNRRRGETILKEDSMTTTSSRSLVRWTLCTVLLAAVAPLEATLVAQDTARAGPAQRGGAALVRGDVELTRAGVQADRMTIVDGYMDLTDAQSEKFWPLYREYRGEAQKANDETVRFVSSLANRTTPLSEAEAKRVLDTHLARQEQVAKLNTKYAKKFLGVLPARQVARLFQLENKMDAIVAYELAGIVPLIGDEDRSTSPPDPRN
jgi:hypothetical protein